MGEAHEEEGSGDVAELLELLNGGGDAHVEEDDPRYSNLNPDL